MFGLYKYQTPPKTQSICRDAVQVQDQTPNCLVPKAKESWDCLLIQSTFIKAWLQVIQVFFALQNVPNIHAGNRKFPAAV